MFGWQLLVLHAIAGVCTPVCLSAASISVEAVTPPFKRGLRRAWLMRAMGWSVIRGRPSFRSSPLIPARGRREALFKGSAVKELLPIMAVTSWKSIYWMIGSGEPIRGS